MGDVVTKQILLNSVRIKKGNNIGKFPSIKSESEALEFDTLYLGAYDYDQISTLDEIS